MKFDRTDRAILHALQIDGRISNVSLAQSVNLSESACLRRVRQLEEAGVTPDRIYASHLCTKCRAEEFDSFRRDQAAAGRMYSFAGIR